MTEQRVTSWPQWIVLTLGFFVISDLFVRLAVPVNSNDLWWHIALGRQVLDNGSLIADHSVFTWTPATTHHAYSSWLADIIFYMIDRSVGIVGFLFLRYGVFFSILLLTIHFAVKKGVGRHPLAWVIVLVGLSLCGPSFLIKPELFSMGFMTLVVWLYYHYRSGDETGWWHAYLFPIILIVWVNTHGAFFLSALFFASTIAGEFVNVKFYPEQAMSKQQRKHYFIAMLLSILAITLNPYGVELPLSIINSVFSQSAQDYGYIGAYQPTFVLNKAPHYILEYLILAMILFVVLLWQKLRQRQADWVAIFSFIIFSALFTQMIRTTYFLAPVFIFSSLDLLSSKQASNLWPRRLIGKYVIAVLSAIAIIVISWRTLDFGKVVFIDPASWYERMRIVGHRFPKVEADYIASYLKGRKVGNLYGDGGYLIYRLWPDKKVMIDPRYFPFKEWIDDYMKFSVEGVDIEEFVNSKKADYWLINHDKTKVLEWFSKADQWTLAFFGPVGAVFVPSSEFNGITRYSGQITSISSVNRISKVLTGAVILGNMPLAKEIRLIAEKNIGVDFKYKEQFLQDVDSMLLGFEALMNQDLQNAANLFANGESLNYGVTMSAKIYRYLAGVAWQRKDYLEARKWSIAAYEVLPSKILPDIYNIALTDWHVRYRAGSYLDIDNKEVQWERYADILIDKKDLVGEKQQSMVNTMIAMKEGVYDGQAHLFQQSVFNKNPADQ